MSSLNLNPNPTIILVQAGIFFANFIAIKKLFLEPYLKTADKRSALTFGNREEAGALNKRNEEALKTVSSRMEMAREKAALMRQTSTAEAERQRNDIVLEAETEAKKIIEQVRSSIRMELDREKVKLPSVIDELTSEIYLQTIKA